MLKLIPILFLFSAALHAGENLIKNGSLNEGEEMPLHWEKADGLISFYMKEKGRGRIIKLDTAVARSQALAWAKTLLKDPKAKAPKPKYLSAGSYATIGAVEGVMLDSDYIKAKPGQNYKLTADFKGDGTPFIWIKGFRWHPKRKGFIDAYQTRLAPESPSKTKWKTFSIGFNPTKRTPYVLKFKVRVYAYWPSGKYYFDNIRVEEIDQKEMDELVKKRGVVKEKKKSQ
ncbi:MAG: hypothetical protein HRT89_11545 [Lentisphaeria bacterium]|nr:hypothetical protein [Lentisphaeria bacterium]NQZ68689.1 hypothetical protein [Lentisphaeria bacterium]